MRIAWGLVLALGAGCIEPQLQECGDLVCPVDSVCLSDGVCASREAVTACDGLAEGAVCQTVLFDGACTLGACAAARCGDGIVSGAEQCDGAVIDRDCVEFGFDSGVPACNDRCDLDVINSCVNFGWRRVYAQPVKEMWSNGTGGLAFIRRTGEAAEVQWNGTSFVEDTMRWQTVVGNATTVYAVRVDALVRSTGGAWESVPSLDLPSLGHVELTNDGTLYMAEDGGCDLDMLPPGGTWTTILDESITCTEIEPTETGLLVGFENGEIRRWTKSANAWSVEVVNAGAAVVSITDWEGLLFYATGGGLYVREGSQTFHIVVGTAMSLSSSGPFVYFHDGDGGYRRIDNDAIETLWAPTFGDLYVNRAGGVYVYGNGIYELTPLAFANHDGVSGLTSDIVILDGNGTPAIATPNGLHFHNDNDHWDEETTPEQITSLAGHYTDELFVSDGDDLWYFDGGNFTIETPSNEFGGITDLWMQPEVDYLVAVGAGGLIMSLDDAYNWDTHTVPPNTLACNLKAVTGNATDLYVVGECNADTVGIVWKRSGSTTWTEVYRGPTPLASVTIASDGEVFAAGPNGGARTRNGVWGSDPRAQGISISATTSTDVFCGGGPGEMLHWDGTLWSRIALVGAISPRVVATPSAVYFAGASAGVLLRH